LPPFNLLSGEKSQGVARVKVIFLPRGGNKESSELGFSEFWKCGKVPS